MGGYIQVSASLIELRHNDANIKMTEPCFEASIYYHYTNLIFVHESVSP